MFGGHGTTREALFAHNLIDRPRRLGPREPRAKPWAGRIVALDTEGSAQTGKFTATACYDELSGAVVAERFTSADDFAEFLIDVHETAGPVRCYFHNLEWDLQVILRWFGKDTRLIYDGHMARKNGSALKVAFGYAGRREHARKIILFDSFAIWTLSLAKLGTIVGLPKLRTPRAYIPHVVNWQTGAEMEPRDDDDDTHAPNCDEHDLAECTRCYDLRDAAILHRAMHLYVDECNAAQISPSVTRSAHAMKDWRTNYLPHALVQYTERENLRADLARYGGRSQMVAPGITVAAADEVIAQFDVASEYPSIMRAGRFPSAAMHHVLHRPRATRVNEYVGFAWARVTIPEMELGPLIYRHPSGRTLYPSGCTIAGAWTTDELAYALSLGCSMDVVRLEGTPDHATCSPFSEFVQTKIEARLAHKAEGNPIHEAEKLTLNGLSGKFGMRWTDDIVGFGPANPATLTAFLHDAICERRDEKPKRYPDYIMVPWSALIMARGRIMVHRFAQTLIEHGAQLLACDTDSWTVRIKRAEIDRLPLGKQLGQWEHEGSYRAFRGVAPKEYALYADEGEMFRGEPSKARAKGIGGIIGPKERARAVDHYLRAGDVHFQRPHKMRSVMRGAPIATFAHVHKARHVHAAPPIPDPPTLAAFTRQVRADILAAESRRLWLQRKEPPPVETPATAPAISPHPQAG